MLNPAVSDERGSPRIPLGAITLIGVATLAFEILLTRIFSVTTWYHFAFVAISLAPFGIAASGVFVTLAPDLLAFLLFGRGAARVEVPAATTKTMTKPTVPA